MNYYNEFDPKAAAWIRELIAMGEIPNGFVDERSITEVKPHELSEFTQCHFFCGVAGWPLALRLAGWPEDYPLWSGSAPCQPFSVAGKGLGTGDERHLWPAFFKLIEARHPSIVFGEQVASSAILGKTGQKASATLEPVWLDRVRADLEGACYTFGAADIPAAGVNAPHIRQRAYWVAYASGEGGCWWESLRGGGHQELGGSGATRRLANTQHPKRGTLDFDREDEQHGSHLGRQEAHSESGARREICGMAHPQSGGLPINGSPSRGSGHADQCSEAFQLANVQQQGLEGLPGDGGNGDKPRRLPTLPTGSASQSGTISYYSDFVVLPCRDGKARRVESKFIKMVDGLSIDMVCGGNRSSSETKENAKKTSNSTREVLRSLREEVGAEEDAFRHRGHDPLQAKEILRPGLHGKVHGGGDKGDEPQEQPEAVCEGSEREMLCLPNRRNTAACPSHRRESDEQCTREFGDFVRLMSSSSAFSEFYGDAPTKEALLALRQACAEEGILLYPPYEAEKAWRSYSCEKRQCYRDIFCASGLSRTVEHPLAGKDSPSCEARTMRLKGYGNAIHPILAAEFILASLEAIFDDGRPHVLTMEDF